MNTDWHDLIQRYIAGLTTEEEATLLQDSLKRDDAVARLYIRYMNLDVALEAHAGSQVAVTEMLVSRPQSESQRSPRWRSWRPLTAAAAGIVFGMFFTSVVFGYVVQRAAVKRTPLPVFDPSFEGMKPFDIGLPHNADEWGVRSARMVPAENGVRPLQGQRMLRMEPVVLSEQDENLYSQAFQILDLRPVSQEVVPGSMEVQVTASFCASRSKGKARHLIRVVALNAPPEVATESFWSKAEDAGVVSLTQRFEMEAGDSGWHSLSVKVPLPHSAQSLVIILSAISAKNETAEAAVRYLDDVQVSLLTSPAILP